jgi:serine phosphatase RsbU (regulator of sigma subunit)
MLEKLNQLLPPEYREDSQGLAFLYFVLFMSTGGIVWGTLCSMYDLYTPAIIPFGYTFCSILNLLFWNFYTKKIPFAVVKGFQSFISLLLPYLLEMALGGFVASGGVMIWAVLGLMSLITFYDIKGAIFWLFVFLGFTIGVLYFDSSFFVNTPEVFKSDFMHSVLLGINLTIVNAMVFFIGLYFINMQKDSLEVIAIKNQELKATEEEIRQNLEELNISNAHLEEAQKEVERSKNTVIAKKNKSILSSINYAKKIQKALLPQKGTLQTVFEESFVLYKPRDVVSGDFYWLEEKKNKIFLALGDCTGHGVPGAFMSMLGISSLNKIVSVHDFLPVHKLMEFLHIEIRKTLRQATGDNRDGMDIGLCIIDRKKQTLEFAGAKVPLCYFQNNELIFVKGNKTPIGGIQREEKRVFDKHVIDLSQTTTFYFFSDGYIDQFGGPENRKFSSRRLKNLLHSIHTLPMKEQKTILNQTIKDWQGITEKQIDDIAVMGVKVTPTFFN